MRCLIMHFGGFFGFSSLINFGFDGNGDLNPPLS